MKDIRDGGQAFPIHPGAALAGQCIHETQGMTLRQYAAIKLKVPNSGTDWLDDMIRESLRDDVAGRALQGLISRNAHIAERCVRMSQEYADAMLKEREK